MLGNAVVDLMQKYGSDLTLTRQVGGAYDSQTGTVSGGTPTPFNFRGVFINYDDKHIDGTLVLRGDRRLLMQARGMTTAPALGDVIAGHRVIDVRPVAPNGVAIAYSCQVRA